MQIAIHPIARNNDFLMFTKPLERSAKSVAEWIRYNRPGGMIYGQKRRGKTRLLMWLKKYLASLMGYPISVVIACCRFPKDEPYHMSYFTDNLLTAVGEKPVKRLRESEKFVLIRNKLAILARRCPAKKVVLAIDEAQRLKRPHMELLISLVNELEVDFRVQVVCLVVGQPELLQKRQMLIDTGELQITGRLMPEAIEFLGHQSAAELEFAFGRYDDALIWPRGSGISYSCHHAPDAFGSGWRLASEAAALWTEFIAQRELKRLEPLEDMSAQALTGIAYLVLNKFAPAPAFTRLTPEAISEVILAQGYLDIEPAADSQPEEFAEA